MFCSRSSSGRESSDRSHGSLIGGSRSAGGVRVDRDSHGGHSRPESTFTPMSASRAGANTTRPRYVYLVGPN